MVNVETKPIGWGILGGSGFALTAARAILDSGNGELLSILTRNPEHACSELYRVRGERTAAKLGGRWLERKVRFGILKRFNLTKSLGRLSGPQPKIETNLEQFLNRPDIGAVWVVTPPHKHLDQVVACLEAGKHVLVEKPVATTASAAQAIVDAASARPSLVVSIGHHMRQHPILQQLRQDYLQGRFGRIEKVHALLRFHHPSPSEWHQSKELSGGWALCEAGSHLIDLALWFIASEVDQVDAQLSNQAYQFETDDRAHLTLRFANGVTAELETVIENQPQRPEAKFAISGSAGTIEATDLLLGSATTLRRVDETGRTTTQKVASVPLHTLEARAFGNALRGGLDSVLVSSEDGLKTLQVIERARGW